MRVLFDENVPRKLRGHLVGHSVTTVQEMGWASIKNGQLLKLANGKFDILITVDKNMRYQQNFTDLDIAVMTILVRFNKLPNIVPIVPKIMDELDHVHAGKVINISAG